MKLGLVIAQNLATRHSGARAARATMCNCRSENPYARWWLWIPGLRQVAHPGMTDESDHSLFSQQTQFHHPAARYARGLQVIFATSGNQRAQGMPDARCTRGPVRNG